MLQRLRGLGLSATVLEAGDDVGGTWYWNRYPGARCDIPTTDYTYSWDPELEYGLDVVGEVRHPARDPALPAARRRPLRPAPRHPLLDQRHGGGVGRRRVDVDDHHRPAATASRCRWYVMATGCLSMPKEVDIAGTDRFQGEVYFTSRWPHEGVDLTGKRVGVIGTGSSGIQSIPIIAEQAVRDGRVPAHAELLDPGPQRPGRRRAPGQHRRRPRGLPRRRQVVARRRARSSRRSRRRRRCRRDEQRAALRGRLRRAASCSASSACSPTRPPTRRPTTSSPSFLRDKIRVDRRRPGDGRDAVPEGPPVRHQAAVPRHRLLRDVQPAPRHARRPAQDADQHDHRDRHRDHRRDVRVRRHRLRHRLRRHDRRHRRRRHHRHGRRHAQGQVGARPAHLPRPDDRRLPEPVHDHRTRAARRCCRTCRCRSSSTSTGSPTSSATCATTGFDRIEPTETAEAGWVQHVNDCGDITLFPTANSWYMGANVPGKPRVFLPYIGGVDVYRKTCDDGRRAGLPRLRARRSRPARSATTASSTGCSPTSPLVLDMMAGLDLPPLESMSAEEARDFMTEANAARPPGPEVGEIVDGTLPGAGGDLDYRLYRPAIAGPAPARRLLPRRRLGARQPRDRRPVLPRPVRAQRTWSSCRSTTATRPRPGSRRPPTTPSRPCSGSPPTPPSSAACPGQLVVAGWSAGGNLAAVVSQKARDAGGPEIIGQLLITPVTDCDLDTGSYRENADGLRAHEAADGVVLGLLRRRRPSAPTRRARRCGPTTCRACRRRSS